MSTGTTPYLSMRQRGRPGYDQGTPRRGDAAVPGTRRAFPLTLAPGMVNTLDRVPGQTNDSRVIHDRHAYYQKERFIPQGDTEVDWTRSGPHRPNLHMRQQTWAREQGSSNSRYPAPNPTGGIGGQGGGLHTNVPQAVERTLPRYYQTRQMRPARVNRLAAARYSGQSYSQTTVPQGGAR